MEYENTAGSLKISSEVVASIAEYAVKEVEGVACLAPIVSNIGGWLLEKQTIKPISIQMNEGKATIDIRLLVEPNAKIPRPQPKAAGGGERCRSEHDRYRSSYCEPLHCRCFGTPYRQYR